MKYVIPPPNTSFQRTRVRGGRGPGPLNSKRWRGAARHANDTGSCRTPCVRRAAPANRSFEGNPRFARTPLRSALGMKDARFAASFTARVPLNSRCR